MKDSELDPLVQRLKGAALPPCPDSTEANVLSRIRLARSDGEGDFLSALFTLVPRAGIVAGALVLTLLASSAATFLASSARSASLEKRQLASSALDFHFFGETRLFHLSDK